MASSQQGGRGLGAGSARVGESLQTLPDPPTAVIQVCICVRVLPCVRFASKVQTSYNNCVLFQPETCHLIWWNTVASEICAHACVAI